MAEELLEIFRKERSQLERLEVQISSAKDRLDDLRAIREKKWRELVTAGVPRAVCAKWSGVDPMMVTRALQNLEDAE